MTAETIRREIHFVGLQMMEQMLKYQNRSWINILEYCITTHSWWDSVDWIAKLVGKHFKTYPELQHPYARKWISSDHMWLQRVAIIHQLFYREKTDEALLFEMILSVADRSITAPWCVITSAARVWPQRIAVSCG